jgi:hypothetical protein
MRNNASALIYHVCSILGYELRRWCNLLFREGRRLFSHHQGNSWLQTIFVIRTHLLNEPCLTLYTKCVEEFGPDQVFILYDETQTSLGQELRANKNAASTIPGNRIIPVCEAVCRRLNPLHRSAKYSAEAHVVCASKSIPATFRFLWMIEGDVYCHGSIKQCLQPTLRSDADFLAKPTEEPTQQVFRSPDANPKWPLWRSLQGDIAKVPLKERKGCFFPIIRCSKHFIELLENNLTKSSGFCEVYFPTLCRAYGLRLSSLPRGMFGEFCYRPPLSWEALQLHASPPDNRLYHPLKSFGEG